MRPIGGFQGSVMVTSGGSVLADLTGGLADVDADDPVTPRTPFQICSVSKQFAAAAAMLLVEDGRLDLHEPIDRWLPDAPSQWRQVTFHHLLSHTAGVPHWLEAPGLDPAESISIDTRLETLLSTPLRTEPGTRWHYSSLGFLLVGVIIAKASGVHYRDFVIQRIIDPLGLTRTTVGGTPKTAARGYNGGQPVTPYVLHEMPGAGDIWSTAEDLTRFTVALHSHLLITAGSLRTMVTAHAGIDDDDDEQPQLITTGYGYGMFTGVFADQRALYHPGDNPGYRSLACWFPDQATSVVILVNNESINVTDTLRQLLPGILGTGR